MSCFESYCDSSQFSAEKKDRKLKDRQLKSLASRQARSQSSCLSARRIFVMYMFLSLVPNPIRLNRGGAANPLGPSGGPPGPSPGDPGPPGKMHRSEGLKCGCGPPMKGGPDPGMAFGWIPGGAP